MSRQREWIKITDGWVYEEMDWNTERDCLERVIWRFRDSRIELRSVAGDGSGELIVHDFDKPKWLPGRVFTNSNKTPAVVVDRKEGTGSAAFLYDASLRGWSAPFYLGPLPNLQVRDMAEHLLIDFFQQLRMQDLYPRSP